VSKSMLVRKLVALVLDLDLNLAALIVKRVDGLRLVEVQV